jgi:hypothetical protein
MVRQPEVEHKVRVQDFERWLASQGRTPDDVSLKGQLREVLSIRSWSGIGHQESEQFNSIPGPVRLPSGDRRILTALAQYSQGRSKSQVAVLAGYALNGGGFNNYLGALSSRGLMKGEGDRLAITDAGIEALGSWEPLPTESGLVDYWRGRLGKAERLILETLTQVYPDALTKEEVAVKAGVPRTTIAVFANPTRPEWPYR